MKVKMRYKLALAGLGVAAMVAGAGAQQSVVVPIATAKFIWSWAQGAAPNDGVPTEFRVKCGVIPGTPTKVTVVPYPTLSALVKDIISGPGTWTCAVTAANQIGESPASPAVTFVAGSLPVAPGQPVIVSQ